MTRSSAILLCVFAFGIGAAAEPLAGNESSAEALRQYNTAAALHNLGSWEQAASEWQAFLDGFPQDARVPRVLHYLGVCHFNQKRYEAAADAFQRSIDKQLEEPLRELSFLYRGIALFEAAKQGKGELFASAKKTLEAYLKAYPQGKQRAEASFYLAEILYFQGQKDQAAEAYRAFLRTFRDDPKTPDVLYALATCEEELGNRQSALKNYEVFANQYPQHAKINDVLYRLGEVHYALGNYEQADVYFRRAGADSRFADADLAVIRSGDALVQLKRFEEAAGQYASVKQRFPQSNRLAQATLGAAKCLYQAGRYDQALPMFLETAKNTSLQGESLHWAARCYLKLGQPQQALDAITPEVIQSAGPPWNASLQLDRADALYELPDRREAAVQEYARAAQLASDPTLKGEALYAAAHTALGLGQYATARQHAEQFQKEVPKHPLLPEVLHVLAECELGEKRFDSAAKLFDELAQKYPKNPLLPTWRVRQLLSLQLDGRHQEVVKLGQGYLVQLSSSDDQANVLTLIAASQLEQNDVDGAHESVLLAINRSPKGPQADRARLLLAVVCRLQNRTEDARTVLQKLIDDFPQSPVIDRAFYRLGEYSYELQDFTKAEESYRRLLQQFPQSPLVPAAMYELACTMFKTNRLGETEQICQEILKKFSNDVTAARARYLLGLVYSQTNQADRALALLNEALQAGLPRSEKLAALYVQGLIHLGNKTYDQAISVFRQILNEDPNYADADKVLYQWAWAEKLAGRNTESTNLFQRLIDNHPNSPFRPEAEYHVAGDLYARQQYDQAARLYHRAFESASQSDLKEKAVHRLGWCYFKLGQFENAAKTFSFQKSSFVKGALASDAAFMEAESLFRQNKYAEALPLYDALTPLDAAEYEVLRLLHAGQAAARLDQVEKARKYLDQLRQTFPNAPEVAEASLELGAILFKQESYDQAISEFQRALAVAGAAGTEIAAKAQFMIGEIEMARKQYDSAVKSFFRVAYGYQAPKLQADALFEAARCFEMLDKPSQAQKLYQELLDKFPNSERSADAKAKLESLNPQVQISG